MRSIVTDRCVGLSVCLFVTLVISLKTAEPIGMLFGFRNRVGAENHMLDGVQKGATLEDRRAQWKYKDFLPWAVQERLNRSICRLDCGLEWAERTSSIVFARRRQCAHMGRHIGTTWRIRLNRPSAAAMRSYVKLLWPLVMVALCNRADHYIFPCDFYLSSFFSSPNLSGRRLDVYHTSTHGVALVRI